MAIALATEHLETNALQFWKWEKKWIYKSDTFNTLSDTERKKWKKSSFNNTNYQEILSKCLQRRFRHLETFTLPKSSWAYQEMCNKTTPYEKLNIEIDNAPPGSNPRGTRKITVFYAWKKKKKNIYQSHAKCNCPKHFHKHITRKFKTARISRIFYAGFFKTLSDKFRSIRTLQQICRNKKLSAKLILINEKIF